MLVGCVLQLAWCRAGGRGCCANLRACWGHKTRKKSAASKAPKCRLLPLKRHCALHLHCWLIYVPLKLRALSRASSHECGGAEGSMARRGQICAQEGAGGRQGRGWEGWGGAARRERHHVASQKLALPTFTRRHAGRLLRPRASAAATSRTPRRSRLALSSPPPMVWYARRSRRSRLSKWQYKQAKTPTSSHPLSCTTQQPR